MRALSRIIVFSCLMTSSLLSFALENTTDKTPVKPKEPFRLKYNGFLHAALDTTLSPAFYVPAALATIAFYDDIGRELSEETREDHPFWGDRERAAEKSNDFRTFTSISMISSSLLFVDNGYKYVISNLGFDALASFSANEARSLLRDGNRRGRPNGNEKSFPSGHATAAGARVALSNYNIFRSNLKPQTKWILATTNWTLAYMVGYSRIESHNHYPEDVLAGIAIGYWTANVLKKTFTNTFPSKTTENWTLVPYGTSDETGLYAYFTWD